jgi:hypothetical protein
MKINVKGKAEAFSKEQAVAYLHYLQILLIAGSRK